MLRLELQRVHFALADSSAVRRVPQGGKRSATQPAHEAVPPRALPRPPSSPEQRARELLAQFRHAVEAGANPFLPSQHAADGAGACRSVGARQAAAAYFACLQAALEGSSGTADAAAAAPVSAAVPDPADAAAAAALSGAEVCEADVLEYVRLAELLPALRTSVQPCRRQAASCCGVGPHRKVVRCVGRVGSER